MSRKTKSKIATDGSGGLAANPFAALDASGLPEKVPSATTSAGISDGKSPRAKAKKVLRGRVEVRREKAGRGGKTVTTLRAFPSHVPLRELDALAFDLKKTCACGGTLKGRDIELQGDVRDKVLPALEQRGYQPVSAGG